MKQDTTQQDTTQKDTDIQMENKAEKAGAWVHVDGDFGLWAAASRKYGHLVKGMEKASSWSVDAHKTLNAGYDCGIVLCRFREALVSALQAGGAYIPYGEHRDGMRYTTEMSRRTRAVLRAIQNSGICWCGGSKWKGRSVIRVSVCSHAATKDVIDKSVTVFRNALQR